MRLEPRSLNIFIFPPSFDHLERLRDRGLNSERDSDAITKTIDKIDASKTRLRHRNDELNVAPMSKAAIITKNLQPETALERSPRWPSV
jgi:hypothetical protein